jgi:hypothetical protein
LSVLVNDVENAARERLFLRAGQTIELRYRSPGYIEPEVIDFEELFEDGEKPVPPQKAPQLQ